MNQQMYSINYNKIQFKTTIKLLHVSAPDSHPQGVFLRMAIWCQNM